MNSQGCGKPEKATWFFPSPWQTTFFIWWIKAFPCCKAYALMVTKKWLKSVFSTWNIPSTISNNQRTHFTGQITWVLTKKPHKLLGIITVTNILYHQARSTKLMENLDLNRTKINNMALNELISMILIFMTFCLTYYQLLISVFQM